MQSAKVSFEDAPLVQIAQNQKDLEEQIATATRIHTSKVSTLMKSIDKLQKDNLLLHKRSKEANRTGQYKRLQAELGRQDVMIEALRCCVDTSRAQELLADAITSVGNVIECKSCNGVKQELFKSDNDQLCKQCYCQRFWQEPAPESRVTCAAAEFPATIEELQEECRAVEHELGIAKRASRKQQPSKDTAPTFAAFSTVSALTNLLAGYVQRSDQLRKENETLQNQREQLERSVADQEEVARLQLQQQILSLPGLPGDSKESSTAEDLESRLRLRQGEMDRMTQTVAETQRLLAFQSAKQEAMQEELAATHSELSTLQRETDAWVSIQSAGHAKHLDKLKRSQDQTLQQLKHGREQLKATIGKLRKSLKDATDQRSPLEVQTRSKAQAARLIAVCPVKKKDWPNFWSQLQMEEESGMATPVRQVLSAHGVQVSDGEMPDSLKLVKVEDLKRDLCKLEIAESEVNELLKRCGAREMHKAFQARAEPKLAALDRIEKLSSSEQETLQRFFAEVQERSREAKDQWTAFQAALQSTSSKGILLKNSDLHNRHKDFVAQFEQVNQVTKALEEKVEQLQARAQVAKEEIIAGRLKDEAFAEA
ncbi:unnamed protein product, partial [Effrenium voratum]